MSTAFHPEKVSLFEDLNEVVVCYLCAFATPDQANWDSYLPSAEYAYNSSVHHSTQQTCFELNLDYELLLPLNLIADLQWPQANKSSKTLPGREFVERLRHILAVSRGALQDA